MALGQEHPPQVLADLPVRHCFATSLDTSQVVLTYTFDQWSKPQSATAANHLGQPLPSVAQCVLREFLSLQEQGPEFRSRSFDYVLEVGKPLNAKKPIRQAALLLIVDDKRTTLALGLTQAEAEAITDMPNCEADPCVVRLGTSAELHYPGGLGHLEGVHATLTVLLEPTKDWN